MRANGSSRAGRLRFQLRDSNVVAEGVAEPDVDTVRLLHRFLCEIDALGQQRLVGFPAVRGCEANREPRRAFRDELTDLPGGSLVHCRRPRFLEQDVASRLSRNSNGQPSHEPEVLIAADFETKLANVKFQRLILVEHEDVREMNTDTRSEPALPSHF